MWDSVAVSSMWIQPGERILWRGRPDARVLFAPQDKVLMPISVVWTGGVVVILLTSIANGSQHGSQLYFSLLGVPFLAFGIYAIVGRFPVKVWKRRHARYAITDQRAVEITRHGRSVKSAPLGTSMEVRRRGDGRHGSAVWVLGPSKADSRRRPLGSFNFGSVNPEKLRGTYWPGAGDSLAKAVAFMDVDGIDGLVTAARHAGFPVVDQPAKGPTVGRYRTTRSPIAVKGARQWVRSRLLRQPYALWSPLPPDEALRRLSQNLTPPTRGGFSRPAGSTCEGTVVGSAVRMSGGGSTTRNSWRRSFDGRIVVNGPGCWLTGTVGPNSSVAVFSAIWLGGVSLFFIGGSIGYITDAATGHGYASLPFVLIPMAMIVFFFVLTEGATRAAVSEYPLTACCAHCLTLLSCLRGRSAKAASHT